MKALSSKSVSRKRRLLSLFLWTALGLFLSWALWRFIAQVINGKQLSVSDNLTILGTVVAFATGLLVVGQLYLAYEGFAIMERQDELLDRRAVLRLDHESSDAETPMFDNIRERQDLYDCWLCIWNDGNRSSGEFYLTFLDSYERDALLVEDDTFDAPEFFTQMAPGAPHVRQSTKLFRAPVFPGTFLRTRVRVRSADIQAKTLRWQIISEDGTFPAAGTFGIIEVDFV